jgi:CubicO group peptidase (beta-lactamase class C family)
MTKDRAPVSKRKSASIWPTFNLRCPVPEALEPVTDIGPEDPPDGVDAEKIEGLWRATQKLYRAGAHPAMALCIRHNGRRVLNRTIGLAAGGGPEDPPDGVKKRLTVDTPLGVFSASKAISAMVIHKLDEENVLRIDDRICDYIPEFARHGKHRMTLRHVLSHRAGVPNLPPEAIDLDLLGRPEEVVEILCASELTSRPGRLLAYHAVTGGFILAEVVKRATGKDMREVLEEKISKPLGLRWLSYGVPEEEVGSVARNALTGLPVLPPMKQILNRALGVTMREAVELSNEPRFLTGIIPSANICATADEVSVFYQCLLQSGEYGGQRVFAPRTVRHATAEQSFWEIDFTLGLPIRYGLGFMLGNKSVGLFGRDNPFAFGHLGLSNVFSWADPERALSVALLTTGKGVVGPHVVPLVELLGQIGSVFDRDVAGPPS